MCSTSTIESYRLVLGDKEQEWQEWCSLGRSLGFPRPVGAKGRFPIPLRRYLAADMGVFVSHIASRNSIMQPDKMFSFILFFKKFYLKKYYFYI